MMEKRIKVLWICHFTDSKVRSHLQFSHFYYKWVIGSLLRKPKGQWFDMAVWVSNAIKEFENFKDVELTILFPHIAIKGKKQQFTDNGINYICFRSEDDNLISSLKRFLFKKTEKEYTGNRRVVKDVIKSISPDLIHVIGAENPYYSISALDIPENIPSLVSLQTLISNPDFFKNYPITKDEYDYKSTLEAKIIKKCKYIASPISLFKEIVLREIKPDAIFLKMTLAVGQDIDITPVKKEYDFVYFSANINKAADYAIEAFAIVASKEPNVTLNISGSYFADYKEIIDGRLGELGIKDNVFFTGAQPTHEDVIKQIKKSKYALLPLKIDLISGTIREAMACGLPVITTRTPKTPELNMDRETVLLSEAGNHQEMANNMLFLLHNPQKAEELRENGIITVQEKYSNSSFMRQWRKGYNEILDNFHKGKPFSEDMLT